MTSAAKNFLQCVGPSEEVSSVFNRPPQAHILGPATETAHNILHKHDGCDEQDPPQTEVMHRPFSKVLGKAPEGNKFCEGNCCRKKGPRLVRLLALSYSVYCSNSRYSFASLLAETTSKPST